MTPPPPIKDLTEILRQPHYFFDSGYWLGLAILTLIASALRPRVSKAVTMFSWVLTEPRASIHGTTSSSPAAITFWLISSSSSRTSANGFVLDGHRWSSVNSGAALTVEHDGLASGALQIRQRTAPGATQQRAPYEYNYRPCNSSDSDKPSPSASTLAASRLGLAVPVSIRDMYVRTKPHRSAKAS